MSSILTNTSAMVALDTLRGINKNLGMVQSEISTGKTVATARDNAAIWAISTVMSTDAESFNQISNSLNLGSATVGVARSASEQVTNLLQDMKGLIVSAQEENVDRTKIQTDVAELVSQIESIVGAAQFNGQNLISGGGSINVLSSLDRASDGSVTASNISVNRSDLSTSTAVAGVTALGGGDGGAATLDANATDVDDGEATVLTLAAGALADGTSFEFNVGGTNSISYVSRENDTLNDVARNLKAAFEEANITGFSVDITNVADPTTTDTTLTINNDSGVDDIVVTSTTTTKDGTFGGGLAGLDALDVSTTAGASTALSSIEGFLQTAIDAAANFGSKQTRIDNQVEFVSTLTDSLKTGIGALTDANLEEASARLQSLQVQQQLGVQALSIANQGPQQLLALFR